MSVSLRRANLQDLNAIQTLVDAVVRETYGHLFAELPPADGEWEHSWIVTDGENLIGVGLSGDDVIDDLWVAASHRRRRVGQALLSQLELEIAGRGHQLARLRVVAENAAARAFYGACGWREIGTYPHERWGFTMVDMEKTLVG